MNELQCVHRGRAVRKFGKCESKLKVLSCQPAIRQQGGCNELKSVCVCVCVCVCVGGGFFNASLILNATASAEKLHNLLQSSLQSAHAQKARAQK